MKETFLTLKAEIAADEQVIADLYKMLSGTWDQIDTSEQAIVIGYYRSAYSIKLDAERLRLVVSRARRLKEVYADELAEFQKFLDEAE